VYLCSVVGQVSPVLREGSRCILEPLNPRRVPSPAVAPVVPRLPGLARPLPLRCTLPDLHQKPAKPIRALLVVGSVISVCYLTPSLQKKLSAAIRRYVSRNRDRDYRDRGETFLLPRTTVSFLLYRLSSVATTVQSATRGLSHRWLLSLPFSHHVTMLRRGARVSHNVFTRGVHRHKLTMTRLLL